MQQLGRHIVTICTLLAPLSIAGKSSKSDSHYFFGYTSINHYVPPTFTSIPLDGHLLSKDWSHTPGSETFTCSTPGKYIITYTATYHAEGINDETLISIRTLQNMTEVLGGTSVSTISNNQTATLTSNFIIQANPGDTFQLQHKKSINQGNIALYGYGDHNISATVTVYKKL